MIPSTTHASSPCAMEKAVVSFANPKPDEFGFYYIRTVSKETRQVLINGFSRYKLYEWTANEAMLSNPSLDKDKLVLGLVEFVCDWVTKIAMPSHRERGILVCFDKATARVAGCALLTIEHACPEWQRSFWSTGQLVKATCTMSFPLTATKHRKRLTATLEIPKRKRALAYSLARTEYFDKRSLYLSMIATHEDFLGRRVGTCLLQLVEHIHDVCYPQIPCYLETNDDRLEQLYMKHGFETKDKYELCDPLKQENFPHCIIMLRPPKQPKVFS